MLAPDVFQALNNSHQCFTWNFNGSLSKVSQKSPKSLSKVSQKSLKSLVIVTEIKCDLTHSLTH